MRLFRGRKSSRARDRSRQVETGPDRSAPGSVLLLRVFSGESASEIEGGTECVGELAERRDTDRPLGRSSYD